MNNASKIAFSRLTDAAANLSDRAVRFLCMAGLACALLGATTAQPPPAPGPGTAVVEAGVHAAHFGLDEIPAGLYELTSKETLVRYGVDHMGFSEYWGTFPGATGTLSFDPKAIGATKISVKIPIYQVETTNRELNGQLFSDEFFDAENYPYMTFVSTKVIRTGPNAFKVTGDLTMHNITKATVLDVTFHGAGQDPFTGKDTIVGFDAMGAVLRSDFGLGKYVPIVSDKTTINISAEFRKKAAS